MWSWETFFDSWERTCKSSSSTCNGVLPSTRASWVSVVIFVGIRFKIRMCSGRMSWLMARDSVMTNIFSLSSTPVAGRLLGILIGMAMTLL